MSTTEKFTVSGSQLLEKVKQLIHEGTSERGRGYKKDGREKSVHDQ